MTDLSDYLVSSANNPAKPVSATAWNAVVNASTGATPILAYIPAARHAGIAAHTDTGDLSTYVQAAIDAAGTAGGGVIRFPRGTYNLNIQLKPGVVLVGECGQVYGYTTLKRTVFKAYSATWVVDTPSTGAGSAGIVGIDIVGLGVGSAHGGIRFRSGSWWSQIRNVFLSNMANQGILLESGSAACVVEDILAINCLLLTTRAALIGIVEDRGTDSFFSRIEASGQGGLAGSIANASLYVCGLLFTGTNSFATNCVGEFCERGIHSTSPLNRIEQCRGDTNYGVGGSGTAHWVGTAFIGNSQVGSATYPAFDTAGGQGGLVVGCYASGSNHSYGFDSSSSEFSGKESRWQFVGCRSISHVTAEYREGASQENGWIGGGLTHHDGTTTPNVEGVSTLLHTAVGSTTVTNFPGGVRGQKLTVLPNPNVIIANNSNIVTASRCSEAMVASKVRRFTYGYVFGVGNAWVEDGVSTGVDTTVNRPTGNLYAGLQYFDTTLGKPVWRNAANSGWVDATGTAV